MSREWHALAKKWTKECSICSYSWEKRGTNILFLGVSFFTKMPLCQKIDKSMLDLLLFVSNARHQQFRVLWAVSIIFKMICFWNLWTRTEVWERHWRLFSFVLVENYYYYQTNQISNPYLKGMGFCLVFFLRKWKINFCLNKTCFILQNQNIF